MKKLEIAHKTAEFKFRITRSESIAGALGLDLMEKFDVESQKLWRNLGEYVLNNARAYAMVVATHDKSASYDVYLATCMM